MGRHERAASACSETRAAVLGAATAADADQTVALSPRVAASGAQVVVYVSLGSNQGDSGSLLEQAADALRRLPRTVVTARSSLYRTAPVGYVEQPHFLNQVVALRTSLSPLELLDATQGIERAGGRVRGVRWGPRTLDVDILWYDDIAFADERLQLPHPRVEERRFVLEPLAELVPDLVLAGGCTVAEALAKVADQPVERLTATEG